MIKRQSMTCALLVFGIFTLSFSRVSLGQCSEDYFGLGTINEVFRLSQGSSTSYFIEVKLLSGSLSSSDYGGWTVQSCTAAGCTGQIPLSSAQLGSIPWIVVDEPLIGNKDYIDINGGMLVTLQDGAGDTIDYLRINGFGSPDANCTPPFEWDYSTQNNNTKNVHRVPDGAGNWDDDPGNSGGNTEGDDNSGSGGGPEITVTDIGVIQGEVAEFTISLGAVSASSVTVNYETQDETAAAGSDYTSKSGSVVIAAGSTSTTVQVQTLKSGSLSSEIFRLVLTDTSSGQIVGQIGRATIYPPAVALWRFEETSWSGASGEVEDESGNGLHGTAHGAITNNGDPAISGSPGTCRYGDFNGSNQYIEVNDNSLLDLSDELTVMAWINTRQIPGSGLKSIVSKDENFEFHINSSGGINWWWNTTGGTIYEFDSPDNLIQANTWYHVAISYRSGQQVIYINGNAVATATYTGQLRTNSDPLHIGQDQFLAGRYFNGFIDEVRLYRAALPSNVIGALYQTTFPCELEMSCGVFPDGVATHTPGSVYFGYNAYIPGNTDTSLNAASVGHNGGSSVASCDVANCEASGQAADALSVGSFPAITGTTNLSIGWFGSATAGTATNEYDSISTDSFSTLTFSSNYDAYYIDSLSVGWFGTVYLPAGDYWVNQLTISSSANIRVVGTGVVKLYVNGSLTVGSSAALNTPGKNTESAPEQLVLYSTGNINLNNGAWVTGGVYAEGDISMWSSSYVHGAVSGANVTLGSGSRVYYNSALSSSDLGGLCVTDELDHFRFTHGGSALNCQAEPVLIGAYDSEGNLLSDYDGSVELSVSATHGDWSTNGSEFGQLTVGTVDSGSATYTFSASDQGEVTLLLRNTHPETVNLGVSDGDIVEHEDYDEDLIFAATGFRFLANDVPDNIGEQVAGRDFSATETIKLEAVRTDDQSGACEAFLSGQQDIEFAFECKTPETCSSDGYDLIINGQPVAENESGSVTSYQSLSGIDFGDDNTNQAELNINYPDAGRVVIHARKQLEDESGNPTELMQGSSNAFDVKPAGFCVQAQEADSSCELPYSDCSVFKVAGGNFFVNVLAVAWETADEANTDFCDGNAVVPNFQLGNIPLKASLPSGHGGTLGDLSVTDVDFVAGLDGDLMLTERYNEVGAVVLTLGEGAIDYLSTSIAPSTSDVMGRFVPDHFSVQVTDHGALQPSCNGFSYLGESLSYLTAPELRITAFAAAPDNNITQNYTIDDGTNNFRKLQPSDLVRVFSGQDSTQVQTDSVTLLSVDNSMNTPALFSVSGNGIMDYQFVVNDSFTYQRSASAQVEPFTADIDITIQSLSDADGVAATGLPASVAPVGVDLRFGRWRVEHGFGSDLENLSMLARVEYWNGSQFLINGLDNCTDISGMMSTQPDVDPDYLNVPVGSGTSDILFNTVLVAGDSGLQLTAPGAGNEGQIQLDFDLSAWSWLQYDWDNDGAMNSSLSVKATFGRYRGHDRIIYWREVLE